MERAQVLVLQRLVGTAPDRRAIHALPERHGKTANGRPLNAQ